MREVYYTLLREIQQYYPVGFPFHERFYPGFNKVLNCIETKKNRTDNDPWKKFYKGLKDQYLGEIVYFGFFDFPSDSFMINVSESKNEFILKRTFVKFSLSLICNYYTVYVEDELIYDPGLELIDTKKIKNLYRPHLTNHETSIIETIHVKIKQYFPEYSYIEYSILQKKIIGSIPYGVDINSINSNKIEYPLFDFLFGYFKLEAPEGIEP